jgi:hypothetical protein
MIPASFTFLDALPLTPAGKIDRNADFPAPHSPASPESDLVTSEFQTQIMEIWRRRLGRPDVGLDENFFDAGGIH